MSKYDLIVIGGGAGGLVSAGFAASLGVKVALVSRSPLGGECLYTGCVPSKALLHAAKVYHTVKQADRYGISVTNVSCHFQHVMQQVKQAIARIQPYDSPEHLQQTYGVHTIYQDSASFIDPHTVQVGHKRLHAKKFILATGAKAILPPTKGLTEATCWTHETLFSQTQQPERLAILGAGPVGIEICQAMQRLGSQVTVIYTGDRILTKEDPETSAYVQAFLEAEGVTFLPNTTLTKVAPQGAQKVLVLNTKGQPEQTLLVDALFVAVGKQPVTQGLNLEAAGVRYDTKKGIAINAHCRTTARHIWAVGDVTNQFQFTHYAEHQAKVAVMNAFVKLPMKQETHVVPWVTFTDPEVAHVGLTAEQANQQYAHVKHVRYPLSALDRPLIENHAQGFLTLSLSPSGAILGATMVGENAGEVIHTIALAMKAKKKLTDLTHAIYAYPTLSEAIKNAAYQYYQEEVLTGWKQTWLKCWVQLNR